MPFAIVGDAQTIRELLCGPIQHNEHCIAWRWHDYMHKMAFNKRYQAVEAELRKMSAERREREAFLESA